MPRTVQLRICITSITILANSCLHYKWAFAGRHYVCVCERDQERHKHDRMTGNRSSSTMAKDAKKGKMRNEPSVNDAWMHVQQAHTKAHVLARDVHAYRTRSQDLLRVGQHQVVTMGRKRAPRNFSIHIKKIMIITSVGAAWRRSRRKRGEEREKTKRERTCGRLFFA